MTLWLIKCLVIAVALGAWFWTQAWLAKRPLPAAGIGDRVHDWTAPMNRWLHDHPGNANILLIATSALIDAAGIFLLAAAVFGPSFRPFVGLLMLFVLRQICQGLCALPPPQGMIWRNPGFPSLLVTYGTATDLFFSGHTAIAVYAALELAHAFGAWGVAAGTAFAAVEAVTVLVLRAHYTLDVFTGAIAALWVWTVAVALAPGLDAALVALVK